MSTRASFLSGHLTGEQVTAYADGQIKASETERVTAHLQHCTQCANAVQREAWLKVRLSGLGGPMPVTPKVVGLLDFDDQRLESPIAPPPTRSKRRTTIALAGAGTVGAAVFGVMGVIGPDSGSLPARISSVVIGSVSAGVSEGMDLASRYLRGASH